MVTRTLQQHAKSCTNKPVRGIKSSGHGLKVTHETRATTERTRARLLLHNVSFEDGFGAGYITRHLATGHWRTSASIEHRERHIRHCPNDYAALSREGTCARLTRRTYLHGLPPSPPWRDWSANGGEGMASVLAFWASSLAWCLAGVVAYGALGGLGMLCRSLAERWSERAST